MKIAIITGASSGLGVEFAKEIDKSRKEIDEIWLIARREDKLQKLSNSLNIQSKVIPLDITDKFSLIKYKEILESAAPQVKLLVNNAGFGKLGDFTEISTQDNTGMIRLNCESLTAITSYTLPFMSEGSEIINTCSIASFVPNTRMAVYSSTKAFVMSFSRALRLELKKRKINVLASCPGPMETEFLSCAGISKGKSFAFDKLPKVNPNTMAKKSLIASKKKKAVYTNRFLYKFYRILAKILPHSIVMKIAGT